MYTGMLHVYERKSDIGLLIQKSQHITRPWCRSYSEHLEQKVIWSECGNLFEGELVQIM